MLRRHGGRSRRAGAARRAGTALRAGAARRPGAVRRAAIADNRECAAAAGRATAPALRYVFAAGRAAAACCCGSTYCRCGAAVAAA